LALARAKLVKGQGPLRLVSKLARMGNPAKRLRLALAPAKPAKGWVRLRSASAQAKPVKGQGPLRLAPGQGRMGNPVKRLPLVLAPVKPAKG
jgi:hypothetical protein